MSYVRIGVSLVATKPRCWRSRPIRGPTPTSASTPPGNWTTCAPPWSCSRWKKREVLLLVAWERLTPAEVARTLDIPQGTARSRLHRARQLMAGELDGDPDHERDQPSVVLITTSNEENHS